MNRSALLALPMLLAACSTTDDHYPSLAPRAVEKQDLSEPAAVPSAAVTADPTLDALIARQAGALDGARRRFDAAATRATAAARSPGSRQAGSEAWLAAQQSLADLDAARADTLDVVGALDEPAQARAAALTPAYPALESARAAAQAQADDQARQIALLQDTLPRD